MSAANFYWINSAAVFAVTDNGVNCHRVRTSGARRGWSDVYRLEIWDHARSYCGRDVLEKSFSVLAAGVNYDLNARIVRRSGYWSGACLDWDVTTTAGSLAEDFRGDRDDMAAAIAAEILEDRAYYDGWNEGLCAINRPRIERAVAGALDRIARESDALCAWGCDIKLRCLGHFSNGEAVYSR